MGLCPCSIHKLHISKLVKLCRNEENMLRALYISYTGMLNQQHRLDTITNNLANSATTGYKKEGATSQTFDKVLMKKLNDGSENYIDKPIGKMSLGVKIGENFTDYSQGSFKATENSLDLAIVNDGFFEISFKKANGESVMKYTRDGSFSLTETGYLVTKDGDFLQGANGYIQLDTSAEIFIDKDGYIWENGAVKDRVKVVDFEDYNYLKKYGENMYEEVEGATKKDVHTNMMQGYLEVSNVNVISEMIDMITISRAYEANQKFIQTADSILEKNMTIGAL